MELHCGVMEKPALLHSTLGLGGPMGRQKQSKSEKWKHPVLTSLALGYGLSKETVQ